MNGNDELTNKGVMIAFVTIVSLSAVLVVNLLVGWLDVDWFSAAVGGISVLLIKAMLDGWLFFVKSVIKG